MWLDTVSEDEFADAGSSKEFFQKWFDVTESMVAEKKVRITELQGHWGLVEAKEKPSQPASYAQPAPLSGYGMAMGTPVNYPQAAQPTATYGVNYPQATPSW